MLRHSKKILIYLACFTSSITLMGAAYNNEDEKKSSLPVPHYSLPLPDFSGFLETAFSSQKRGRSENDAANESASKRREPPPTPRKPVSARFMIDVELSIKFFGYKPIEGSPGAQIGKGDFSIVHEDLMNPDGKVIRQSKLIDYASAGLTTGGIKKLLETYREIKRRLPTNYTDHFVIPTNCDIFESRRSDYFFREQMEKVESIYKLFEEIEANEEAIKKAFVGYRNSIAQLHKIDLFHGDIQPGNLMQRTSSSEETGYDYLIIDFATVSPLDHALFDDEGAFPYLDHDLLSAGLTTLECGAYADQFALIKSFAVLLGFVASFESYNKQQLLDVLSENKNVPLAQFLYDELKQISPNKNT